MPGITGKWEDNMEFEAINTQEEFDARVEAQYGNVAGLQQQIDDLTNSVNTLTGERDGHAATIAELQQQIKGYEASALRQKIAREKGLPSEMADRLTGETEAEIKADAETMAGILRSVKGAAPLYNPEQNTDTNTMSMASMLHELRGE